MIYKLHGDFDSPVFPGVGKYAQGINESNFEILFDMKTKLMRENSVLIVIGYSGNDDDVNTFIEDGLDAGLTVFWFRFCNSEEAPKRIASRVLYVDSPDDGNKNMAGYCGEKLEEVCQN